MAAMMIGGGPDMQEEKLRPELVLARRRGDVAGAWLRLQTNVLAWPLARLRLPWVLQPIARKP